MQSFGAASSSKWHWYSIRADYGPMTINQFIGYVYAPPMMVGRLEVGNFIANWRPLAFYEWQTNRNFRDGPLPACMANNLWEWFNVVEADSPFGYLNGWVYGPCRQIEDWADWLRSEAWKLTPERTYLLHRLQ